MNTTDDSHDPSFLGDLERDVLRVIWAHAPATAEVVREKLGRNLKESTVRTVLHRLEQKGYLKHSIVDRAYVYTALKAPRHVAAVAVKRIADWLCDGSIEELLVGMVDTRVVEKNQLKKLSEKVSQAKRRRKR
jgi:predicted transcriptional regulator